MKTKNHAGGKRGDELRFNRTGGSVSPGLLGELIEATEETHPSAPGDASEIAKVRMDYAERAEPPGSMPPPVGAAGARARAALAETGMMVLLDKLGERLAFERSGVRLYDALLSKHDVHGSWPGGPSRAELEEIRQEEHAHFLMLAKSLEELGADPTAVTPSANLHSVVGKGLPAALSDPRTTLRDGLEAVLVAELVDNDRWENLVDLAHVLARNDLAQRAEAALAEEEEHLARVRGWLGQALANATHASPDAFAHKVRAVPAAEQGADEDEAPVDKRAGAAARPAPRPPGRVAARKGPAPKAKPPAKTARGKSQVPAPAKGRGQAAASRRKRS